MAAISVQVPYPVFYNRDGQPLDNGNIYIGIANLDPVTNPLQVYYDEALTIPASQPLKTSSGYVYRNGTPTQLYVNANDFSITVKDDQNLLVYTFPEATGIGVGANAIPFTGFKGQIGTLADLGDADGSDWIGYTPVGLGSVARSAQDKMRDFVSVKDFGAVGDGVTDDTAAIQAAISSGSKSIYIPAGTYDITLSGISVGSDIEIYGDGDTSVLQGPDPLIVSADVTGTGLLLDGVSNVNIRNIQVKNGYKGVGIKMIGSSNIKVIDVTVDGFTDGIWIGEDGGLQGCQNVTITRPIIKNSRYWGVYIRALNVVTPADFTKYITLDGGYFYNCNMAGFVVAEGTPEHIMLSNTNFNRCPVAMHFELCRNYTVVNCKDYDTNKYPDQVPCNFEYPFPTLSPAPQAGWSQYHYGSSAGTVVGCTLEQTVNHYASSVARTTNLKYGDTQALVWVYQGAGGVVDTNKNFFESHSWDNCLSTTIFIFQIDPDATSAYLRNFKICNSECQVGINGNSPGGTNVAIQAQRVYEFSFQNSVVRNGYLRIKGLGNVNISGNNFFGGTDRNQTILDGNNGAETALNYLTFSNNQIMDAGGVVTGDSAILVQNWSVIRADSFVRGSGNTNYVYRFKDSYRLEIGPAFISNAIVNNYVTSGITATVTW